MIKSENRLRKNKQFVYIYKHGKAVHSSYLTLVFVKTKVQPYKVGFTVSKKIGKSVVRSKIKRRLTECFNLLQKSVNPENNYIFVSKPGIEELTFYEMLEQMKKLMIKGQVLKDDQIN